MKAFPEIGHDPLKIFGGPAEGTWRVECITQSSRVFPSRLVDTDAAIVVPSGGENVG